MQIKCLHSNIYKLNSYTLSQEKCEEYRKKYEKPFRKWQKLKLEGVSDGAQYAAGISRATYFRYKRALGRLTKGILPPTKRPQWNGGVERGNRIFREEFYARRDILSDSIGALKDRP